MSIFGACAKAAERAQNRESRRTDFMHVIIANSPCAAELGGLFGEDIVEHKFEAGDGVFASDGSRIFQYFGHAAGAIDGDGAIAWIDEPAEKNTGVYIFDHLAMNRAQSIIGRPNFDYKFGRECRK